MFAEESQFGCSVTCGRASEPKMYVDRETVWVKHLLAFDAFEQHHGQQPRENNRLPRFSIGAD